MTKFVSKSLHTTVSMAVPVYNTLLDKLENLEKQSRVPQVAAAAAAAKGKLCQYYHLTEGSPYYIATCWLLWCFTDAESAMLTANE